MGVCLRKYSPCMEYDTPIKYTHQDDYFTFGYIESGKCNISVDFNEYSLEKGNSFVMFPGQVHSFISSTDLSAYMLIIDSLFIDDSIKQTLARISLLKQPIRLDNLRYMELQTLFHLLSERMELLGSENSISVIKHISLSIICIISECIHQEAYNENFSKLRYMEHTTRFLEMLRMNIHKNHSPSYYAEQLNISSSYLNEAVKITTGVNVSQTIQNELVLRAKRALVYTNNSVKEIALALGFEDCAYFTRLFTKNTGISPNSFRKNRK